MPAKSSLALYNRQGCNGFETDFLYDIHAFNFTKLPRGINIRDDLPSHGKQEIEV